MLCSQTAASGPGEQIGGARLDLERRALPSLARLSAKAQRAGRKQRHADDLVELRLVPMPADSRAGSIFVDENLAESIRRPVEDRGNLASQRNEKRRKRRGLNDGAAVIVVAVAEAHHLAVGQIAMKVERLERELGKLARERLLFFDGEDVRMVAKPLGQAAWARRTDRPERKVKKIGRDGGLERSSAHR